MDTLRTTRSPLEFTPDPRRVIAKPFLPSDALLSDGSTRWCALIDRVMAMPADEATESLAAALALLGDRHREPVALLERSFDVVADRLAAGGRPLTGIVGDRRRLVGAYFTHEYSIEAAALGNPSIVPAPDQGGVDPGSIRFVMSLRAIGEGHISSIEFRIGVIDAGGAVTLDPPGRYAVTGNRTPHPLRKSLFTRKLDDMGMLNDIEERVMARLADEFTITELEASITALDDDGIERSISGETTRLLHWLASSNYRTSFDRSTAIAERVLFPSGPTESHGMEDARFVRFVDDDAAVTYYGTYTAYDGHQILPQLLETADFTEFRVTTMGGRAASNKGIAIFPRRIGGRFMALGRQDNINNYLMRSDDVRVWTDCELIQEPQRPWELMQLGNCGSPIETDAGWLVITHGVGPLRRYTLGALLLDLDDPSKVIGHLDEPLLEPDDDEREGYVPNVVYSCGSIVHGDHLVLPYGYADVGARIATTSIAGLLARLTA